MKKYGLLFLLLLSPLAQAIGIGSLTAHSALGERLLAEVPLLNAEHLSNKDIIIRVASAKEHQTLQVPFSYFSHSLRFTLVRDDDGKAILIISSTQAVIEPYLNFLLKISTPEEQLLKELSLLINMPNP